MVDYKDTEYDVGAGELAKFFPDNIKLFGDECKLMREGKEIVDALVHIYNGEYTGCNPVGCVIQMNGVLVDFFFFLRITPWYVVILPSNTNLLAIGPNAQIASVHLTQPDLYVAVPESKVYFPKTIATMSQFLDTLDNLLILKVYKKHESRVVLIV